MKIPKMEYFNDFFQLMIDCRRSHMNRVFVTGSQAEVEGNERSIEKFCEVNTMDVDYMMYSRDGYIFKEHDKVPAEYRGAISRYVTEGTHPGYVRLWKCDDTEHTFEDFAFYITGETHNIEQYQFGESYDRTGPSLKSEPNDSNDEKLNFNSLFNNLCATNACSVDHVIARHSPYWPGEAAEWITRPRPRDSLSRDVIRRVVGYGCDFVCVSHQGYVEHREDHEWRFSFSLAELILIKNWSREQRAVYRTIRVLHKRIQNFTGDAQLQTYHFKTLMLWAVETKAKGFWEDIQLLDSVCMILMDMMRCLSTKSLPHYFMPKYNFFNKLLSKRASELVNALADICTDTALVFDVLRSCQDEEVWNTNRNFFISIPSFLHNKLLTAAHTTNEYLSAGDDLIYSQPDDDLILLKPELKTVHALIELSSIKKFSDCAIYRDITCEKCNTNKLNEAAHEILRCNKRLRRTIDSFYERVDEGYSDREIIISKNCLKPADLQEPVGQNICALSKTPTEHTRCVLFSRGGRFKSVNILALKEETPIVRHIAMDTFLDELTLTLLEKCRVGIGFIDCIKHYKFSPKISPTVPIFWFINKAYTANHYYTLLSDYETTLKICDEIFNAYNISKGNKQFAEQSFPVLLTTRWIDMYDRELQQTLGLSALCRFVIHGSDNGAVHIPACPVQFAIYLKARCSFERSLHLDDERAEEEFFEHHFVICTERTYFSFGSFCLTSALRTDKLRKGMTV